MDSLSYSEVFQLLLAIVMAPIILRTMGSTKRMAHLWMVLALISILGSYVFTIAEGFVAPTLFNDLEHACLCLAGIFFAVGSVSATRHLRARLAGDRS